MADLFELIATVVVEALSVADYKKAKVRRWTLTVIHLLIGAVVVGILLWNGWDVLCSGTHTGKLVVGGFVLAVATGFLISVIHMHRKDWGK